MKIVFMDRDGVINKFPGNGNYVTKVKEFHFLPGALEAVRLLTEKGYTIFIISNQAGVGKGVYSKAKLEHITEKMLTAIKRNGGKIKRVFYCTHRSDHGCGCRKPEIGSIEKALQSVHKPMSCARDTFLIGDTEVDIKAGHNAGCKTIFVLSGREDHRHLRGWQIRPNYIAKNLLAATDILNRSYSKSTRPRRKE